MNYDEILETLKDFGLEGLEELAEAARLVTDEEIRLFIKANG